LTAEYVGFSRGGNKIIIVAHGVGPMSTLDGILKAYSFHFNDKTRDNRGGRISQEEFLKLERGGYGDVHVVDYKGILKRNEHAFWAVLNLRQALEEPLLAARLGKDWYLYLTQHAEHARKWHNEQSMTPPENRYKLPSWEEHLCSRTKRHVLAGLPNSNPFILEMSAASNCSYEHALKKDGLCLAHLLSIGRLMHLHHDGEESLVCDVGCHEWYDGVRLLGLKKDACTPWIHQGPQPSTFVRKHWQKLMKPVKGKGELHFCKIMKVGRHWFTEYSKHGESLDTCEPEFLVTSMEKVGEIQEFHTPIGGFELFFRYGIREVKMIAPYGSNAYAIVGDPVMEGQKYHRAQLQFYKITADTTKRVLRSDEIKNDYDALMRIISLAD
jgi:hypothetical protein